MGDRRDDHHARRARRRLWTILAAVVITAEACAGGMKPNTMPSTPPVAPPVLSFTATAYCQGTVTASGTRPSNNTVAADPAVLPLGSQISLTGLDARYNGVYTVLDTGPKIRGRRIDLYIRDCHEAVRFGRRQATVAVLR